MFISYAQNCEDVLLFRALGHVEKGCYVDVGAADPVVDSVTCAFYQRGWRGINIEPSPGAFQRLSQVRAADVNLNIAVGEVNGSMPFFLIGGGNVLSTGSPEQLQALQGQGWKSREIQVPVRRLEAVLQENHVETIHFLKVDVEGAEREVLSGVNLTMIRPWIILVEATAPNSQIPTHEAWENILTGANYRFAWFDGLNRFYVAAERGALFEAFKVQPNVFDQYVKYSEALANAHLKDARASLQQANATIAALQQEVIRLNALVEDTRTITI